MSGLNAPVDTAMHALGRKPQPTDPALALLLLTRLSALDLAPALGLVEDK